METMMKLKAQLKGATTNKRKEISAKREREKIKRDEEDEERKQKSYFIENSK